MIKTFLKYEGLNMKLWIKKLPVGSYTYMYVYYVIWCHISKEFLIMIFLNNNKDKIKFEKNKTGKKLMIIKNYIFL